VRSTLAEQFAPVLRAHAQLRSDCTPALDVERARARVASGYFAYDPAKVLASSADVRPGFTRMLAAFEVAGLISNDDSRALMRRSLAVDELVTAWLRGDWTSRDPRRHAGLQVAGLVGNAVLGAASALVFDAGIWSGWTRTRCPCCGGAADIALTDGNEDRTLICARCDTRWTSARETCLGCHSDEIGRIRTPSLEYDLVICNACGRFIMERESTEPLALIVERAITAELALAAEQRGLRF
jgi:hypothetical protein